MKRFLLTLALLSVGMFLLPVRGVIAQDTGTIIHNVLPDRAVLFEKPLGDPRALSSHVTIANVNPETDDAFLGALVGIATRHSLYRGTVAGDDRRWEVDLEAGILSQFDLDQASDDLLNTDYFVGFPISFEDGPFSTRVRIMHQSSHLGDELLLNDEAPDRVNLSLEFVDVLLAYESRGWRVYTGGLESFNYTPESLDPTSFTMGLDYHEPGQERSGQLIGGIHYRTSGASDWQPQLGIEAGVRFGALGPGSSALDIRLEYFDGPLPFGQFYTVEAEYIGIGLSFET